MLINSGLTAQQITERKQVILSNFVLPISSAELDTLADKVKDFVESFNSSFGRYTLDFGGNQYLLRLFIFLLGINPIFKTRNCPLDMPLWDAVVLSPESRYVKINVFGDIVVSAENSGVSNQYVVNHERFFREFETNMGLLFRCLNAYLVCNPFSHLCREPTEIDGLVYLEQITDGFIAENHPIIHTLNYMFNFSYEITPEPQVAVNNELKGLLCSSGDIDEIKQRTTVSSDLITGEHLFFLIEHLEDRIGRGNFRAIYPKIEFPENGTFSANSRFELVASLIALAYRPSNIYYSLPNSRVKSIITHTNSGRFKYRLPEKGEKAPSINTLIKAQKYGNDYIRNVDGILNELVDDCLCSYREDIPQWKRFFTMLLLGSEGKLYDKATLSIKDWVEAVNSGR